MSLLNSLFTVQLEDFDGPIDLLLHLVKRNELPLERLSLAKVADQYLETIRAMGAFDLDIAGEYLVIAATLLSLKSSILLNIKGDDGGLLDEGPDPYEELLMRLREAEVYLEAAQGLGRSHMLHVDVFERPELKISSSPGEVELAPHQAELLAKAFRKILQTRRSEFQFTIHWEKVSVVERMQVIYEKIQNCGSARFSEVLSEVRSRALLVASFVAILELCKRQLLRVTQEHFNEEIFLSLAGPEGESVIAQSFESEFDAPAAQAENL